MRSSRLLPALLLLAGMAIPAPAGALTPCVDPGASRFQCGTVRVPLDREGVRSGTLRLPYAVEPARPGARKWVLALSGGPGQSSIVAADQFRYALGPLLRGARLVVLDQRGTGAGALRCPALQAESAINATGDLAVASCASRLGPARVDYTTADTVADLEVLRARLGAKQLTIMGVSYGTYVAVSYARAHPDRVERLVLDSPVGPAGIDPLLLDSFAPLQRIVGDWCAPRGCPAVARRAWEHLAAVAARLQSAPLRARVGRSTLVLPDQTSLMRVVGAADLNPALQALLPAALAEAAAGRPAPLLRLMRAAAGAPLKPGDLSVGLNVATVCADVALPYGPSDDLAARDAKLAAAAAAVDTALYRPLTRDALIAGSVAHDCRVWPSAPGQAAPVAGPVPDVPALILSGTLDQRTPTEGARSLAALMPRSSLVLVPGAGHDTIDTDLSGCVNTALRRFAAGRAVGRPCRSVDDRWRVADPLPARYRAAGGGITGAPPSVRAAVGAALRTLQEARLQAYALLYGGFETVAGAGPIGGRFVARNGLELRSYSAIPGVRVTARAGRTDVLAVRLPDGRRGRIVVAGSTATGTIGGRPFRVRAPGLLQVEERFARGAVAAQLRR